MQRSRRHFNLQFVLAAWLQPCDASLRDDMWVLDVRGVPKTLHRPSGIFYLYKLPYKVIKIHQARPAPSRSSHHHQPRALHQPRSHQSPVRLHGCRKIRTQRRLRGRAEVPCYTV